MRPFIRPSRAAHLHTCAHARAHGQRLRGSGRAGAHASQTPLNAPGPPLTPAEAGWRGGPRREGGARRRVRVRDGRGVGAHVPPRASRRAGVSTRGGTASASGACAARLAIAITVGREKQRGRIWERAWCTRRFGGNIAWIGVDWCQWCASLCASQGSKLIKDSVRRAAGVQVETSSRWRLYVTRARRNPRASGASAIRKADSVCRRTGAQAPGRVPLWN